MLFRLTCAQVQIDQSYAVIFGLIFGTTVRGLCLRQLFDAHYVRKRRDAAQQ